MRVSHGTTQQLAGRQLTPVEVAKRLCSTCIDRDEPDRTGDPWLQASRQLNSSASGRAGERRRTCFKSCASICRSVGESNMSVSGSSTRIAQPLPPAGCATRPRRASRVPASISGASAEAPAAGSSPTQPRDLRDTSLVGKLACTGACRHAQLPAECSSAPAPPASTPACRGPSPTAAAVSHACTAEVRLDLPERREVEDERLRQLGRVAEPRRQPVAELDRAERVEPRLHQRRVGRHARQQLRCHLAHGRRHVDRAQHASTGAAAPPP